MRAIFSQSTGLKSSQLVLFAIVLAAGLAQGAQAQSYKPLMRPPASVSHSRLQLMQSTQGATVPTGSAQDSLTCANPPSLSDTTTKIVTNSMTASEAISAGFPLGGINANQNTRVLIQDWTRSKPCIANDGKTMLEYGQAVRVIATISEIDASAQLTLATIAAQATLNNKASNIQAVLAGISDNSAQTAAASLLGPLDVENFADKSNIVQTIVTKTLSSSPGSAVFLGVVQAPTTLQKQVAAAFATQAVLDGKSCVAAKGQLHTGDASVVAAVEGVYTSLLGLCDTSAPTAVAQAAAKDALMGLQVKPRGSGWPF